MTWAAESEGKRGQPKKIIAWSGGLSDLVVLCNADIQGSVRTFAFLKCLIVRLRNSVLMSLGHPPGQISGPFRLQFC